MTDETSNKTNPGLGRKIWLLQKMITRAHNKQNEQFLATRVRVCLFLFLGLCKNASDNKKALQYQTGKNLLKALSVLKKHNLCLWTEAHILKQLISETTFNKTVEANRPKVQN